VRFVERFVTEGEAAALFRRADLAVLPYREAEQSGVLYTALGFGVPLVLSDVGGFADIARAGAAVLVPPGDAGALHDTLAAAAGRPPTGWPRWQPPRGPGRGGRLGRDRPRAP
jgi:glycosyltransferase involved in cell wall biosynthesis